MFFLDFLRNKFYFDSFEMWPKTIFLFIAAFDDVYLLCMRDNEKQLKLDHIQFSIVHPMNIVYTYKNKPYE